MSGISSSSHSHSSYTTHSRSTESEADRPVASTSTARSTSPQPDLAHQSLNDGIDAQRPRAPSPTGLAATPSSHNAGLAPQSNQHSFVARSSAEEKFGRVPNQTSAAKEKEDLGHGAYAKKTADDDRIANLSEKKRAEIEAGRGRSQASIDASREAKKAAQRVKVEKKEATPLNSEQSFEKHRGWVVKYDKIKRDTENQLGTLPVHEKLSIPDGVIQGYVYNSSRKDSASKAKALQEMGHIVQPEGYKPPYPPAVEENANHLREQLKESAGKGEVLYTEDRERKVSEAGLSFETSHVISGINQSSSKMYNTTVEWLQRRREGGRLSQPLKLSQSFPKERKNDYQEFPNHSRCDI